MTMAQLTAALLLSFTLAGVASAQMVDKFDRKGRGYWVHEYKNGGYELKREKKPGEYKEEIKLGDDISKYEAKRDGSWKEEIKEDGCEIKRERTSSGEYKEERSC